MNQRKIVVQGTGGTLTSTATDPADNLGYRAGQLPIAAVLASVPGVHELPLESEEVARIDSKDMSFEVWRALAQRCAQLLARPDVAGIVIGHGTDTAATWPRVEIVMSHAGAGGGLVVALVAQGVHGVVVAATGNGSVHAELEAALLLEMLS